MPIRHKTRFCDGVGGGCGGRVGGVDRARYCLNALHVTDAAHVRLRNTLMAHASIHGSPARPTHPARPAGLARRPAGSPDRRRREIEPEAGRTPGACFPVYDCTRALSVSAGGCLRQPGGSPRLHRDPVQ